MSNAQRPYRTPNRVPPRPPRATPRASSRRSSGCGLAAIVLLALVCGVGIYLYTNVFGALARIGGGEDVRPTPVGGGPPPAIMQQPFNVLVIGVDLRASHPEEGARSDTLIVVHVDPRDKWASLLSIPRDTYVQIPSQACEGAAGTKINAAYSCGYRNPQIYGLEPTPENRQDAGAALAAQTVEQFLGITIDYTAQVDFAGFERLIDAIGGITVDVERTILDPEYPTEDYGYMRLYIPAGLQRMDGATALRYARTRHVDNDFGRARRQQQVLQAILDELKRQGVLGQIEAAPRLLQVAAESVRTTLKLDPTSAQGLANIRGLAGLAQELSADRIQRLVLQPEAFGDGRYSLQSDLSSAIVWDPDYVALMARRLTTPPAALNPTAAAPAPAVVQVQNGTLIRGLAAQITVDLDVCGYQMAGAADAPEKGIPQTQILVYTGRMDLARELAQAFGLAPERVIDASATGGPPGVDVVVRLGEDYQPPTCRRSES